MTATKHKKILQMLREVGKAERDGKEQVLRAGTNKVLVATPQLNFDLDLDPKSEAVVVMANKKVLNATRQYGGKMRGNKEVGEVAITKGFKFSGRYPKRHKRNLEEYLATGTTTEWEVFLEEKAQCDKDRRDTGGPRERTPANKYTYAVFKGAKIFKDDKIRKPVEKRRYHFRKQAWRWYINNLKADLKHTRATTRAVTAWEAVQEDLARMELQGAQDVQHARFYYVEISRMLDFWPDGTKEQNEEYTDWRKELKDLEDEFEKLPWMEDITKTPPQPELVAASEALYKRIREEVKLEPETPPPVEELNVMASCYESDVEEAASDEDESDDYESEDETKTQSSWSGTQ